MAFASDRLAAQWLNNPTPGVPRKADGTVDMAAPAPRMADGKPDFSGIWITASRSAARRTARLASDGTRHRVLAPHGEHRRRSSGRLALSALALPIVKERTANLAIDDPHIRCLPDNFLRAYGLPHMLKFVHTPELLIVLNEMNAGYRQVFTDARPLPDDPEPVVARIFVGEVVRRHAGRSTRSDCATTPGSIGTAACVTEAAKVREEIRRPDFGHLEIKVTVDDPKAYTKPWTVTLRQRIVVDAELIDEICLENEQFVEYVDRSRKK